MARALSDFDLAPRLGVRRALVRHLTNQIAGVDRKAPLMASNKRQQFVLLPMRGLRATETNASAHALGFLRMADAAAAPRPGRETTRQLPAGMRVIDSIAPDSAKLIELSDEDLASVRAAQPGLRIAPLVMYKPAVAMRPAASAAPKTASRRNASGTTFSVIAKSGGAAVKGAEVVAFTDFANRVGAQGTTDRNGEVVLALGSAKTLERIYVYPALGYWPAMKTNVATRGGITVKLTALDLAFADALEFFVGRGDLGIGTGVRVGVIDSGVDLSHADLHVSGGANTVVGEQPADYGDSGLEHHGTHVAGIISAQGSPPDGIRGVAPGVELYSYRVFGKNKKSASNYSIAKAIDQAVRDGCDLLNLSLGGGSIDPVLQGALEDARAQGVLPIVAAGNDDRSAVSFPGSEPSVIAVSALGRKGTFPAQAAERDTVAGPFGNDPKNFIASFSNIGTEVDVTGPGVGIMSTIVGGYAVMDGTSMACPAITGVAARALAKDPALHSTRDASRSDTIAALLLNAATRLGFPVQFEGHGLPK
jgi:subtilisin